ncbi:hypothetical protein [Azospirillum thiophilum]|uniref:hypothetical protein n=1 Tax=Azospirillum thiophilum TaxID=528244 RepID=UPI00069692A5|nr:hypothetical protein [Azospirillum thiophilum]
MQISGYLASVLGQSQQFRSRGTRNGDSSDSGGIAGVAGTADAGAAGTAGSASSGTLSSKAASAVDDFLAEAKKTPAQRIRDDWLARHKMTEEDLASMPAEKREAIEKEIAEEMKRKLTGDDAKRGAVVNLTA